MLQKCYNVLQNPVKEGLIQLGGCSGEYLRHKERYLLIWKKSKVSE
jgi:hypothetical protein